MEIRKLNPTNLWGYFADICEIPHPSKHEEKLAQYLRDFAKQHNFEIKEDKTGNILITKGASSGYESHQTVILQSHFDMVPQKNSDIEFDFTTDSIIPIIDGEWVTAQDTTLGADNGIGCAAMLAVLADKELKHPKIEALFTIDEETGLTGANELTADMLSGKILINLDSEDEGELYVGCAGAVNNSCSIDYATEKLVGDYSIFELDLRGLKGGHSGMEIILQRANANKVIVRFIREQSAANAVRLIEIDGGGLRNAIPREAKATLAVPSAKVNEFTQAVAVFEKEIQYEYAAVEDSIKFSVSKLDNTAVEVLKEADQKRIINALTATPNGIFRMSDTVEGLVETSTNISRVELKNGRLDVAFMSRCMVNYGKLELNAMIRSTFELAGGSVEETGDYNGWAPNMDSVILEKMKGIYNSLYGRTPEVKAIHAGLECGIIGAKYPTLDMISCGPTIRFPHSPDEKVKIDTVSKFYEFLTHTLAAL